MIDQHFTPSWAAAIVADALPREIQGGIVDPAAGTGSLLEATLQSGRHFVPIALDSDPKVVRELRRQYPTWVVSRADSLSTSSRSHTQAWRFARQTGVDWVLLNPPFSYRGGPAIQTSFGDFFGRVSPSAQFVAMSLLEFQPRRGIVAVLPDGVVRGEKYKAFWHEVSKTHEVTEIADLRNSAFPGVRAHCRVLRLERHEQTSTARPLVLAAGLATKASGCRCVEVIRGRIPRHVALVDGGERAPYLHTTDIVQDSARCVDRDAPLHLATAGPAVVLPRVGRPNGKIATIPCGEFTLSDCLIALRPLDHNADGLAGELRDELEALARIYRGTGAPYVTIQAIVAFLRSLGWHPIPTGASAGPGACRCDTEAERNHARSHLGALDAAS